MVATTEEELLDNEVAAVIIVINHPVGDVGDVAGFDFVFDGVVDVEAADFDGGFVAGFVELDIGLADGDEGTGSTAGTANSWNYSNSLRTRLS